jgi:hypothetical protein
VAGADKEEFPPILPAGFHRTDLAGLRRLGLTRFPDSFTRPAIMSNFEKIVESINRSGIIGEVWVDGSFLTEQLNPEDVDILLAVATVSFLSMNANQRQFFKGFQTSPLFSTHKCDNYAQVIDPSRSDGEWLYAYWLRQFGFSRREEMKGIAVLAVPFLV